MMTLEELLGIGRRKWNSDEIELLKRAYDLAKIAHGDQKRRSREPYFVHPFETARKVSEWGLEIEVIAASLLHDVIEDTNFNLEDVKKQFGEEIAFLIDGVTKLGHFKYRDKPERGENEDAKANNFRKMILALSEDLRVIFIKLADRLHNMKTLSALPEEKQKRIALETFEIYSPLAYRLGMTNVAGELGDLSLPYLYPEDYKWLIEHIPEKYEEYEEYLNGVKEIINEVLKENDVLQFSVSFRVKRYVSLYRKLKKYNMNIDQIHDIVAMRIIVDSIEDCYKVLGIIHQLWRPLPGKIKDYIALPKPNGYQSLHTTVFCVDDKITEFQIRTKKMHEEAENGIAAHWAYEHKKGTKSYIGRKAVFADKRELAWIKQLREWQEHFGQSGEEFINSLKIDFFKDRIFAVTPRGDVIDLPSQATPIDFAYHIHSDVGNQAVGARVNGKIVQLNYELQSGDVVEILMQKGKKPSGDWLKFVKTSIARSHIKKEVKTNKNFITTWFQNGK